MVTIDELLTTVRVGLRRLEPDAAATHARTGALLVDIRPAAQRATEGAVPGALIVERNVLEWRLDPTSDACLPEARRDMTVIVLCSAGYASSLAAAALQQLGLDATDVVGGFQAWAAAGLPTVPG